MRSGMLTVVGQLGIEKLSAAEQPSSLQVPYGGSIIYALRPELRLRCAEA